MPVLDQITKAQETTFDFLVDGNENLVEWTRSAGKSARDMRKSATKSVKKFQKQAGKRLPDAEVPAPRKLADQYFDFAGRSLELNRAFVTNVLDAWSAPAPKPAAKARKTAAGKAKKASTAKK